MFTPRVAVIKISKIAHFLYLLLMAAKILKCTLEVLLSISENGIVN